MDIDKVKLIATSLDVSVPFVHNSDQHYIAGTLLQDESKYWRVKFNDQIRETRHNESHSAFAELIELVEQSRLDMLNEEFKESGI